MKLHIITNIKLNNNDLAELSAFELDVSVEQTKEQIHSQYNYYFAELWGSFGWIRSLFTSSTDVRAFVTSKAQLRDAGITAHIGMFDTAHQDSKHTLYIGLPDTRDKRAKANGFESNLAWLIIHEILHGEEKSYSGPDRTHDMEKQGRLKELWRHHQVRRELMVQQVSLLSRAVTLLEQLLVGKQ